MPTGSSITRGNRSQLHVALSLCSLLAWACNGTSSGDGGTTAGIPDSGPVGNFCKSIGGDCSSSSTDCCTNLTCQNGTCASPAPTCAGYGQLCGSGGPDCCNPPGENLLSCVALSGAGVSQCLSPLPGTPLSCSKDSDCPAPYFCAQGMCNLADTGKICNPSSSAAANYHTPCQIGDECFPNPQTMLGSQELASIQQFGVNADPCQPSGLVCLYVGSAGLCVPQATAAQLGSPNGMPFDDTACNPKNAKCGSYFTGADHEAPVCGPFLIGGADHCEESCTTGDDCDSTTFDCIKGQCKPNYCFADDPARAAQYSNVQTRYGGIKVSSKTSVLLQPCATSGSYPTACLPQYDDLSNATTGECVRVGGDGSGGWGAPCDPSTYRNNLGGLCQAGTYCYLGTCMPWCDLGNIDCPALRTIDLGDAGEFIEPTVCQPLASGPLVSSTLGATHSLGVCAQSCDPYLDSSQNECQIFPVDAGQPFLGCKLSGNGSDTSPPPGNCVALVDKPVAVGSPCTPFGWLDQCVSGAQCVAVDGGMNAWSCQQLCDPQLSPNITISAPSCPNGGTCVPFSCPATGGACSHMGGCQ